MYIALFLQPGNKASRYIAHRLVKLVGCEDVLFTFELVLLVTQLKTERSPLPIFVNIDVVMGSLLIRSKAR